MFDFVLIIEKRLALKKKLYNEFFIFKENAVA